MAIINYFSSLAIRTNGHLDQMIVKEKGVKKKKVSGTDIKSRSIRSRKRGQRELETENGANNAQEVLIPINKRASM